MPFSSLVFKFACFPTSSTDHPYLRSRVVHCPWKGVHRPPTEACPRGILPRLVHRPPSKACPQSTDHLPGFVQATYQGLSTGRLPRHIYRPPSQACPQSTGHLPRLVHRPPWATIAQRLRTKDCHRSHWKACPRQVTFQGLSATVHLRRLVCCMLPSKACSPQVTFHDLSTGQHPVNITAWWLSILMYSSY